MYLLSKHTRVVGQYRQKCLRYGRMTTTINNGDAQSYLCGLGSIHYTNTERERERRIQRHPHTDQG